MKRGLKSSSLGCGAVLVAATCAVLPVQVASGAACPGARPPSACSLESCDVTLVTCGSSRTPREGAKNSTTPSAAKGYPPQTVHMATCTENTPESPAASCLVATTTCAEPGQTRYWIATRYWSSTEQTYGAWQRRPGSFCLTPDQLATVEDPLAALAATLRAEWKSYGLPAAVVDTQPGGQTLTGAVTRLSSSVPTQTKLPPKVILGYSVTLEITATQYAWDFGDGTSATLPATKANRHVEHTYRGTGTHHITLKSYYRATYSVSGTSLRQEPLAGQAEIPGPVTVLTARQARTQLEAGDVTQR